MAIKIIITLGEFLDRCSDEGIREYGINPYCLNEGLASSSEEIILTYEQAKKWRILPREN